jgi:hypothetical protein
MESPIAFKLVELVAPAQQKKKRRNFSPFAFRFSLHPPQAEGYEWISVDGVFSTHSSAGGPAWFDSCQEQLCLDVAGQHGGSTTTNWWLQWLAKSAIKFGHAQLTIVDSDTLRILFVYS